MNTVRVALIGAACAAHLAPAAQAAHGKVGTWEVSTKMSGSTMAGMPDMSKLPPEVQAKMKARGVSMNAGGGMTAKFCMTADQVNNDKPPMTHRSECEPQNVKMQGNVFSADVVCKGPGAAKGHIEITFDGPTHYSGRQTTTVTVGGQAQSHEMLLDAHWLSPDCTIKP